MRFYLSHEPNKKSKNPNGINMTISFIADIDRIFLIFSFLRSIFSRAAHPLTLFVLNTGHLNIELEAGNRHLQKQGNSRSLGINTDFF